ncbi:MAG: hypothetical protein ACFFA0_05250 [Promethearchaeota archaeon]
MEARNILKKIVRFANWEYKEKRPKSVKILRIKSKSILTLGAFPELQMRSSGPIIYLVVSDHKDSLMIYFFNRNGEMLGGQNYEPTPKFLKKLNKSTIIKYQLPKKEQKEIIDPSLLIQKTISRIHQNIAHTLGLSHKYSYTVLVDKNLQFRLTSKMGCKRIKRELRIPPNLKDEGYLELLATIEWFYSYLVSSIPTQEEIPQFLYDQAILLSAAFNIKFLNKIFDLNLNSHEIIIQNISFSLLEEVKSAITSLSKVESEKVLSGLLKKYCNILKMLKRYKISLSMIEVAVLITFSYEMFNTRSDAYLLYTEERKDNSSFFYFRVFSKIHELAKQQNFEPLEYKSYFLSMIFGLSILTPDEIIQTPYTLTEVIENTRKLIDNPIISDQIQKIDNLASDIISEYIFRYQKFNTIYDIQNNILELTLEIQNESNYVLQDFEYELVWKPEKKVMLNEGKKLIQSRDLHEKVIKTYFFTIQIKGTINFSCLISFTNPLFPDEIIRKVVPLQKIDLPFQIFQSD